MKENHELKVVLSPRLSKLQKEQRCSFCSIVLPVGAVENSYGVIDRYHGEWERVYFCTDHGDILDNMNPEDLSLFPQDTPDDKGFVNEIYE